MKWPLNPLRLSAVVAVSCACLLGPAVSLARAQTTSQLWGKLTLDWPRSNRLKYDFDFEPKVLVSAPAGDPGWWSSEQTPGLSYSPSGWLELLGQLVTVYTQQTDDGRSFEVTPRVGVTWHLFSRDTAVDRRVRELRPLRRVVIRDTVRVEARNIYYSGGSTDPSHKARLRNRIEVQTSINKSKVSDDGAVYLQGDWEYFFPLGDPNERFANKQRVRTGLGYRRNRTWRVEALYIWNRSRNTISSGFTTSDNIVQFSMTRAY
jgi:hypothetical protein